MSLSPIDPSSAGSPRASSASTRTTVRDWTCPFCSLLCDDLTVAVHADGKLDATSGECPRLAQALTRYRASDAACSTQIDGRPATLEAALARAADILDDARHPLFGGLATDVAGARALYALAASCGATLDHLHGEAMSAATRVVQDRGAFFTTLSEIRTRADLLIFFGCRPSARYPRFYSRVLGGTDFVRELVFVGCEADPLAKGLPLPHLSTQTLLPDLDPFDTVALWSALVEGRRPASLNTLRPAGTPAVDMLSSLAARSAAAQYTVLVYEPAALPSQGQASALLIEGLHRIVKAINRTTRAAALALGGDDGALTLNQTVTWLSGLPLPLRVPSAARGDGTASIEHDAHRYRTARLMAEGRVDALLWVASLEPAAWPATLAADVPAIVLGHPALAEAAAARGAPTVFIPAASPGIDSDGHLFRLDGSVVAPLTALRATPLPSVATIVARLNAQRPTRNEL